ncbi:SDR family NAD(P)-dependent oxidoreductase [[Acidovorax] ebreus]|uniref:SDR family NAD(P)-dependent oxidoreductase n=1 Tax=Diaphorobacter sp. LI3 TaxID=2952886 RepID=UPI00204790F7|nr:SDR family oxidoreductase [Diaphorobacter sp. LI3]
MQPVAIVTGGSSNIGWACAQRLAVRHTVVVADVKPPEQPLPAGMLFRATDVTQPEACRALMAYAQDLGSVQVLVHSAAITAPAKPVEQITLDEWRRVIDINLTGAFIVAQAAIPALRSSQGSMVMIASRAARTGVAALVPTDQGVKPHYCASKAGLLSLVRSLATELAADGIRVNAVLPGSIEGAMIPRERWPELAAHIPLRRLGLPEEIADAANFLCSAEARYITGHAMDVNGGTWMN